MAVCSVVVLTAGFLVELGAASAPARQLFPRSQFVALLDGLFQCRYAVIQPAAFGSRVVLAAARLQQ
jgi:hypothetical protein